MRGKLEEVKLPLKIENFLVRILGADPGGDGGGVVWGSLLVTRTFQKEGENVACMHMNVLRFSR